MTLITYEQARRLNAGELEAQQRATAAALRQLNRSSPTYRDPRAASEAVRQGIGYRAGLCAPERAIRLASVMSEL